MCGSAHGFMWSLWARNPGVMLFPPQRYRSAAWRGAGTDPLTQRCLGPLSPWTCASLLSACGQAAELPKSWGRQISFCALARLGGSEHLGFLLPKPAPILLRFEVYSPSSPERMQPTQLLSTPNAELRYTCFYNVELHIKMWWVLVQHQQQVPTILCSSRWRLHGR